MRLSSLVIAAILLISPAFAQHSSGGERVAEVRLAPVPRRRFSGGYSTCGRLRATSRLLAEQLTSRPVSLLHQRGRSTERVQDSPGSRCAKAPDHSFAS